MSLVGGCGYENHARRAAADAAGPSIKGCSGPSGPGARSPVHECRGEAGAAVVLGVGLPCGRECAGLAAPRQRRGRSRRRHSRGPGGASRRTVGARPARRLDRHGAAPAALLSAVAERAVEDDGRLAPARRRKRRAGVGRRRAGAAVSPGRLPAARADQPGTCAVAGTTATISSLWRRPSRAVQEMDWFSDSPISAAPMGVMTDTLPSAISASSG